MQIDSTIAIKEKFGSVFFSYFLVFLPFWSLNRAKMRTCIDTFIPGTNSNERTNNKKIDISLDIHFTNGTQRAKHIHNCKTKDTNNKQSNTKRVSTMYSKLLARDTLATQLDCVYFCVMHECVFIIQINQNGLNVFHFLSLFCVNRYFCCAYCLSQAFLLHVVCAKNIFHTHIHKYIC